MDMTPKEELHTRLSALRDRLGAAGLDGGLLTYAVDVYYFAGTRQNAVLWVPLSGEPVLLVKKSFSRAREECLSAAVRQLHSGRDLPEVIGTAVRRIGVTLDILPAQLLNFYRSLMPDREFADISAINRDLRALKSPWELDQMRMSGTLLAAAFGRIPEFLKPGMRELDLAAEFEYRMRTSGIYGYLRIRGFNQEITGIAVAGANAATSGCFDGPVTGRGLWRSAPYGPSTAEIPEGEPILVDYGGFYNGYITDMTRIFCIGRLSDDLEHAFKVALAIQEYVREQLVPGRVCEDIYADALRMAEDAGLGEHFMGHSGEAARFVGHGVGLELDELPVLAPRFKAPLAAGNVIAVEPKFLFPLSGAVGIENTFAVTASGGEKLTLLPDDIVYL